MGSEFLLCFTILFLSYLFLNSGSGVAETPPQEAIWKNRKADNQENQIPFSSSVFTTQLDYTGTVPIVNPTAPATTTPTDNPTDSPPAPTSVTTTPSPIPPATTTPTITATASGGGQWCIASSTASQTALQVALDYACGYGGADCSAAQPGANCYNPNTVRDHASYAFNDYYQKNPIPTSCVFGGTAQLTSTDPSSGNCHFSTPGSTPSLSPPVNPTPTTTPTSTAPTTMTPPMTSTTGGRTIFGVAEPTGSPSSATSVLRSLLLLFTTAIMGSLAANQL